MLGTIVPSSIVEVYLENELSLGSFFMFFHVMYQLTPFPLSNFRVVTLVEKYSLNVPLKNIFGIFAFNLKLNLCVYYSLNTLYFFLKVET